LRESNEKGGEMPESQERKDKILIVIPAFNEEEKIQGVVQEIRREVPEAVVLVVNDGSRDQTESRARAAGAKVLTHPFNMGYGVTLQTGYKYALKHGFDHVLQMDGDGQHDPSYLSLLLREVREGEADVVIGSRFLGEGEYRAAWLRQMGICLFRFITSRLCGQKITDPTSGYQALNRRAVKFCTEDSFPGDYPDADVLVMMHRAGLRIREVPVRMHPNARGQSMHSGLKPVYYTYKMCLSIALNLIRPERPNR
jgi:glycosyltransferase involved in cell wall biosynthesis